MKRTLFALLLVLIPLGGLAAENAQRVVFTKAAPEHKWTLQELDPKLPADWSAYDFLTLDLKAGSAQRFDLRIFTAAGTRKVRVGPFQGAWTRISVPLALLQGKVQTGFDLASLSNKSRPSSFLNIGGAGFGPVNAVEAIGVFMDQPLGKPALEIKNVHLTKGEAEDAVLEPKPLVDEFGQWIPATWPGKAKSLEELKKAWAEEEAALGHGEFDMCPYGGFKSTQAKATGFFRAEQVDGRWWLVDPDGHLFFSVGATGMGTWSSTRTEGRKGVFKALPPATIAPARRPGANRRRGNNFPQASFFTWNIVRRFGEDYAAKWVDLTARRMEAWGLNTIANWSDPRLWDAHRKAYVVNLNGWGIETGPLGLPDVYSKEFAKNADAAAKEQCAPRKNDPWLIGYFIANEPAWPGREVQVTKMIESGPATATQRELKAFLAAGDTPARRKTFVYRAFDKFLAVTGAAVKKHDPNHMNIGLRFGSKASDELIRACRGFDVFSMNSYSYQLDKAYIEKVERLTGRPIMIGEFHFGTPGRGLSAGLKQTVSDEERGVAYQYYVEQAAALPALVGAHWFQWVDEPNTGRGDGENYNIGVVDVTDRPYEGLVKGMQAAHKRLLAVHSGKEAPSGRKAKVE